ncbi:teichoic acid D-Ala incorporation-associated protein DltX [Companilactobacillus sp.]|nr:teichoic acid D-Ala incorporation-associated protein DltX [Companilactobacillus sp.]MCH4010016.1 teichoic acid D-Ala incorporation-associated protein DltX [Companilactobacillus sp.]MCH4052308.1 teichoic acid D-Ala incorporation-associated protein DltX [Companilactobacillus sp.]MCH4077958.1 teichoic acid D-Ala incorporation-associated protein DltX [Companilactobacillus sp.]MCH4126534.1 teichoic acid D-Ala incorporation-associated protein DltX [Companilactobacillus sp.]MCH4132120.1 teichoic a
MIKILNFLKKPASIFILRTVFYFAILLILLYIYGYNGVGSAKFIYNDF